MGPHSATTDLEQGMAFGRYLLGAPPSEDALRLFERAAARLPPLEDRETRLVAFLLRNGWAIGPVDAALALIRPASPVRGRVFLMLAVLECLPEYAPRFLPATRSQFEPLRIAGHALRALGRALVGMVVLAVASRA
jgi:hypothetical protein